MTPLVSICIPTYNGEEFLSECLNSAISQTYLNLEIIISDDNSQDKTLEIAESFISKTTIPIRIFHHQPSGIGDNWNNCVEHANGDYIKFLFQDDTLEPRCVEKMVFAAQQDHQIGMVFCKRSILTEPSDFNAEWMKNWVEHYSSLHTKWPNPLKEVNHGMSLLKSLTYRDLHHNYIGEPVCTLIKKSVVEEIGGFDNQFKQLIDVEAWYRIISKGRVAFINETLASFRLHDKQLSFINKQKGSQETSRLRRKLFKMKPFLFSERVSCDLQVAIEQERLPLTVENKKSKLKNDFAVKILFTLRRIKSKLGL